MVAVATIWAPDGRVLFDTKWPQMVLVAKGRITAGQQTVTVNNGINPLVAFLPGNCSAAVETQGRSGSTYTFNFAMYHAGAGAYIDYWIYDRIPPQRPVSGAALFLLDEAGNCTFSTSRTPMVLAPPGAKPAGRTYAIAPAVGPYWREDVNIDIDTNGTVITQRNTAIGGWRFNGTGFYIDPRPTNDHFGLGSDGVYDPSLSTLAVLDVTNH